MKRCEVWNFEKARGVGSRVLFSSSRLQRDALGDNLEQFVIRDDDEDVDVLL